MKGKTDRAGKSPFSSCKNSRVFEFSISDKEDSGEIGADRRLKNIFQLKWKGKKIFISYSAVQFRVLQKT